jgi:hypothetical protein
VKFSGVWLFQLGIFLTVMGGMLFGARLVRASEPGMDDGYIETITVDNVELPEGVSIHACPPDIETQGCLTLENSTETILYIMSLNYKDILVMQTPDPNWKSRVGMAHEAASYFVSSNRPLYLTMDALSDLDSNLVDQKALTFKPPPDNATIPNVQSSELLLVYDGQVIEVPFTVSYELTEDFEKGSEAYKTSTEKIPLIENTRATVTQPAVVSDAQVESSTVIVIGLAGVAALFVAGWLAWRRVGQRK